MKYSYPIIYKKAKNKSANPIIFVHGFNSSPKSHNIFADKWNESDYYAIAFPGNSLLKAKRGDEISVESFARLLANFIKDNNLNDVVLIGHSMGGATIALAYQLIPEAISKMIFVAPMNKSSLAKKDDYFKTYFPKTFEEYKTFLNALYYDTKPLFNNNEFMKKEEEQFDPFLYNNPDILKLGYSLPDINLMNKIEDALKKIEIPSLLLLGEKDAVIDREQCIKYFQKHLKNLKYKIFDKTGHMIYYEKFDQYYKIVSEFIKNDYSKEKNV
ncbi:alpha/beta hydrolase [Mesomycoplasma lagogenitalium]|uniref:Alpha/beta hydrolase n=1 Tax=Mesomycoplasma lagogenitalium TaxID=171286 RepID=A0ABY8LU13_9BACT|nr:alpha/beta hydrolase [Mesomycoplasma lagogenitalium]WGI36727.1 alpha/beta hydrolase [Mesomycoplasma lagogenitalium]